MSKAPSLVTSVKLDGLGVGDPPLCHATVDVAFDGLIETMRVTVAFPDQGESARNEEEAVARAQHLVRLFARSGADILA